MATKDWRMDPRKPAVMRDERRMDRLQNVVSEFRSSGRDSAQTSRKMERTHVRCHNSKGGSQVPGCDLRVGIIPKRHSGLWARVRESGLLNATRSSGVSVLLSALFLFSTFVAPGKEGKPGDAIKPAVPPVDATETNQATSVWRRVVVIGASASAGFTMTEPFGGTNTMKLALDRYLDAALKVPHEGVQNFGTALFFMRPELMGLRQIDLARDAKPSLVVAVDFMFWFCYGDVKTDADRKARFEKGLDLLDKFHCPLLVGDIPDASAAVQTGMLSQQQVPSTEARAAANRRLKEWAAARTNVTVIPLAKFTRDAMENKAVSFRGIALAAGRTRGLLQNDNLHPNQSGCAMLALMIFDTFISDHSDLSSNSVLWNPRSVLQRALSIPPRPAKAASEK